MIPAYFIAPVRGKDGDNVEPAVKWDNVRKAIAIGWSIRKRFPELDLFIPHEHEVVIEAFQQRGLSTDAILDACCDIVKTKKLAIAYCGDGTSDGMHREMFTAAVWLKKIICIVVWNEEAESAIAKAINEMQPMPESGEDDQLQP